MAILPNRSNWVSDVYAWEEDDPVEGGIGGLDNRPPQELSDRTNFLKKQIDDAAGGDTASESDPPTLKGAFAKQFAILNAHGGEVVGAGRNLFDVLGVTSIAGAMAALRARCNGTGQPDFTELMLGDYLDGINLSAIPAENGGTAGQVWNATYGNNRIAIAAFNPYKGVGDTEVTKNHIRFDFVNVPLRKRMNPTNDNIGGYKATEIRAFLEGVNGDGTGDYTGTTEVSTGAFLTALKAQLGDYILPVRRLLSTRPASGASWAWMTCSLWLPSENEIFGANAWGESGYGDGQKLHIPLYRDSYAYRIKRYNGSRDWWWLSTPHSASAAYFCYASSFGHANYTSASSVGGCAPAFCIA